MTDEVSAKTEPSPHKSGWLPFLTFLMLALIVIGCGCYFYYQHVNSSFTRLLSVAANQATVNQQQLDELQKSVTALQQADQQSQAYAAKQQQMINEWEAAQKGDLEKWYVAEAEYLVKLANDHVQFTHDVTLAMTLLQRADQILGNLQDTRLLEIRKSIATNLAALQASQPIDTTKVYVQLAALNNLIDTLPLPANPLPSNPPQTTTTTASDPAATWWQKGLNHTWQALSKIVIVRNTSQNSLPLVLPEEKIFLYQNLHAQMENAMWGVLHHNAAVYQLSLMRASAWIQKYFAPESPMLKSTLQQLQPLQLLNLQIPMVNIGATTQLFDHYFAQNKAVAP